MVLSIKVMPLTTIVRKVIRLVWIVTNLIFSIVSSLNRQLIWPHLKQIHDSTNAGVMKVDFPEIFIMHERILLLPQINSSKSQFLNLLGDIYKIHHRSSQDINDLLQAICLYDDAISDGVDNNNPIYFNNLGVSLAARFKQQGDLGDMNKSVLMLEHAVQLTPDGHPSKPSRLNNLGNSLLRRFEKLGDVGDINKSVLM